MALQYIDSVDVLPGMRIRSNGGRWLVVESVTLAERVIFTGIDGGTYSYSRESLVPVLSN